MHRASCIYIHVRVHIPDKNDNSNINNHHPSPHSDPQLHQAMVNPQEKQAKIDAEWKVKKAAAKRQKELQEMRRCHD